MLKFDPYRTPPTQVYMGAPIWLFYKDTGPEVIIDWHGRRQAIFLAGEEPSAMDLLLQARAVIDLLIDIELRGWLNNAGLARQELCG